MYRSMIWLKKKKKNSNKTIKLLGKCIHCVISLQLAVGVGNNEISDDIDSKEILNVLLMVVK